MIRRGGRLLAYGSQKIGNLTDEGEGLESSREQGSEYPYSFFLCRSGIGENLVSPLCL